MTLTAETIAAMKATPFRFSIHHQELRKAYDIARLASDHVAVKLILEEDALSLRSDTDGLQCVSRCKITKKPGSPLPRLAVTMPRTVLEELVNKEANWESLECKIGLDDTPAEKNASHASTTWTFEYGRTHIMCPADIIPMPEPLTSSAPNREASVEPLSQSLRLLKPFVDPETKKNQFTSAFVQEGRAHATGAFHARIIKDKRLVWPGCYIGGRQINDLVHVVSRLVAPVSVADETQHLLFQAENTVCKVRKGAVSADATKLETLSWDCSIELSTIDLANAIQKICSQVRDRQASVRVMAGPSHGASIHLSTEVPGGQARLRLPTPSSLPEEFDLIVPATSLSKLLAPSVGATVELQFRPEGLAVKQDDAQVSVLTVLAGRRVARPNHQHNDKEV